MTRSERPLNNFCGWSRQLTYMSKVKRGDMPTCPCGASASDGWTAPSAVNCDLENRPAPTRACPAGVNWPALLLLYQWFRFLICPGFILLPNEPTFVSGTTSPTVPSPVTSERKISPADPEFGSVRVSAPAVAQWLDMETRVA